MVAADGFDSMDLVAADDEKMDTEVAVVHAVDWMTRRSVRRALRGIAWLQSVPPPSVSQKQAKHRDNPGFAAVFLSIARKISSSRTCAA